MKSKAKRTRKLSQKSKKYKKSKHPSKKAEEGEDDLWRFEASYKLGRERKPAKTESD